MKKTKKMPIVLENRTAEVADSVEKLMAEPRLRGLKR